MSTASLSKVPPIKDRQTRESKTEATVAAIGGARNVAGIDEFTIYEVSGGKGKAPVYHYRYKDEPAPRNGVLVHKAKLIAGMWVKQR